MIVFLFVDGTHGHVNALKCFLTEMCIVYNVRRHTDIFMSVNCIVVDRTDIVPFMFNFFWDIWRTGD